MDTKELWNNVLLEIEASVSKANFTTWFKETKISGFDNGVIYLSVPNTFVQEWLLKKFRRTYLLPLLGVDPRKLESALRVDLQLTDRKKISLEKR